MNLPDPPEGWQLEHLVNHSVVGEPRWLIRLTCRHSYVSTSGSSPRYAMLNAIEKIENGDVFEKLSGMQKYEKDLVKLLGIEPKTMRRL